MNELPTTDRAVRQFCTCRLEHRLYGIDLAEVCEVSTGLTVTPVAHAPRAVRGLGNLRSRIYLILDLRPVLGFPPAECTPDSRLVILKPGVAENVGILVDSVGDIVSVPDRSIEGVSQPPPGTQGAANGQPHIITGICKLENTLLMVVDSKLLVDHVKQLLA